MSDLRDIMPTSPEMNLADALGESDCRWSGGALFHCGVHDSDWYADDERCDAALAAVKAERS